MSKSERVLWGLFGGLAMIFMLSLQLRPYPGHYLIKAIPVFSLGLLVLMRIPGTLGKLMGLGFLFCGIGDILLDLRIAGGFIYGLSSFLTGHLFYTSVFFRRPTGRGWRRWATVALLAGGLGLGVRLFPYLGGMTLPVLIYLVVILSMGAGALLGAANHPLIALGALLFVFSDGLIAVHRFMQPLPNSSYWIMGTYYLAQAFIAAGALKSFSTRSVG